MEFSNLIKKIRTAIYAKDVRGAIADGMEMTKLIATQSVEKAEKAQSEINAAISGKIGATFIDLGNITGTGDSTPAWVSSITGDAVSKENNLIMARKSGKYVYIVSAKVGNNISMHYYPSENVRANILEVSNTTNGTMFINKVGTVTLTEGEYWSPLVQRINSESSSYLLNANIILIRIADV